MESAEREHLEDEDIVRLMDGEGAIEEQTAATSHLHSCDSCRLRAEAMGVASASLRTGLALLDSPPDDITRARALERVRAARRAAAVPGSQVGRGGLRRRAEGRLRQRLVAAGIGVVLLAGLTVEPVRAWILDGLRELAGSPEPAAEVVIVEPAAEQSEASVRFTATGPHFRIDVAVPQEEGFLTLRVVPVGEASAEIVGGAGETLVLLPSGLQVGNSSGSTASYMIELPAAGVEEVEVRVGGEVIAVRTISAVTEELNLTLAPENISP